MKEANEWRMCNKWVKDMKQMKRRGQKELSKKDDEQNKFIYYNNKTYIDT